MSTNLFWRPLDKGKCLSKTLKTILQKSGIMCSDQTQTLSDGDILLLRTIIEASSDEQVQSECDSLINAINQYSEIEIYIE